MRGAGRIGAGLLLLLASGCAGTPDPAPAGPAIVLRPAAPGPARATVSLAPAAAALERDTAALRGQARRYVVRPDSKPEAIARLATLTLQVRRSVERVRANRTSRGYRATDIAAARAAADLLAAFLATQATSGGLDAPVPAPAPSESTPSAPAETAPPAPPSKPE